MTTTVQQLRNRMAANSRRASTGTLLERPWLWGDKRPAGGVYQLIEAVQSRQRKALESKSQPDPLDNPEEK